MTVPFRLFQSLRSPVACSPVTSSSRVTRLAVTNELGFHAKSLGRTERFDHPLAPFTTLAFPLPLSSPSASSLHPSSLDVQPFRSPVHLSPAQSAAAVVNYPLSIIHSPEARPSILYAHVTRLRRWKSETCRGEGEG